MEEKGMKINTIRFHIVFVFIFSFATVQLMGMEYPNKNLSDMSNQEIWQKMEKLRHKDTIATMELFLPDIDPLGRSTADQKAEARKKLRILEQQMRALYDELGRRSKSRKESRLAPE